MTHTESQLNVLALNSGSSSLKFGLYGVGPSRIERLLSGEAESIGDKSGKLHAKDSHGNALLAETGPIPSQREAESCEALAVGNLSRRSFGVGRMLARLF